MMKQTAFSQSSSGGLPVRTVYRLIFGGLFVLLAAEVVLSMNSLRLERAAAESQSRRYASYLVADELRQSVDDLTRMARAFAATGDPMYVLFFNDTLAIREGRQPRPAGYTGIYWDFQIAARRRPQGTGPAVAIEGRLQRLGLTAEELAKLQEALKNATALVHLERAAMNAVKDLSGGRAGNSPAPGGRDVGLGRRILHGPDYNVARARVLRPLAEFFVLMDQRTSAEVASRTGRAMLLSKVQVWLGMFMLAVVVAAFFFLNRRVMQPIQSLQQAVQRLATTDRKQRLSISSGDDVGQLARTFDQMLERLQSLSGSRDELNCEIELRRRAETDARKQGQELEQQLRDRIGQLEALQRENDARQEAGLEARKLADELEQQLLQRTAELDEMKEKMESRQKGETEAWKLNEELDQRLRGQIAQLEELQRELEARRLAEAEARETSEPSAEQIQAASAEVETLTQETEARSLSSAGILEEAPATAPSNRVDHLLESEQAAIASEPFVEPTAPPTGRGPSGTEQESAAAPTPAPDSAPAPPSAFQKARSRKRTAQKPADPAWQQAELISAPGAAPSPAPPPQRVLPSGEFPSELEGLDVASGLKRLAGNRDLYRSLLHKFRDSQARAVDRIEQALAAGAREQAQHLAHALKNMAGQIGARQVQDAAKTVDTAFKRKDQVVAEAALPHLQAALQKVLGAIDRLDQPSTSPTGEA